MVQISMFKLRKSCPFYVISIFFSFHYDLSLDDTPSFQHKECTSFVDDFILQ